MKKILLQLAVLLVSPGVMCAGDFKEYFEGKHWVREYYNEVILAKDRNVFLDYVSRFKERPYEFYYDLDYELYWYEELNRLGDYCRFFYSDFSERHCFDVLHNIFSVKEITKLSKDNFLVLVEKDGLNISPTEYIESLMYYGCDWSILKDKDITDIDKLYVEFDGDYLFIYADEAKTLLATYCMYEEDEYSSFLEAVATNNFDNMEFTFPRHADGTCDYDEDAWKSEKKSVIGTNLRTGKATTVKENLRVHSDERTTSAVRITLAAGTPVEILGIGGEETIDGITSKWVHVKVMPGIMGTDGTYIKWGNVVGWCFGGVVSDIEEVSESANALMSKTAEPAEMVALPEAAVSKPAPDLGKTATVTENLRLRIDEQTTSDVVATLAAGTRVKVLAPGREDTIDGITSNWVQVSVLGGAKDKDGNTIEAGTVGWLFGGYLSEMESAESERVNEEASTAKKSSALPIVPIVASGAVLAVLFLFKCITCIFALGFEERINIILLAVKKKKYEKK